MYHRWYIREKLKAETYGLDRLKILINSFAQKTYLYIIQSLEIFKIKIKSDYFFFMFYVLYYLIQNKYMLYLLYYLLILKNRKKK